MLGHSSIPYLTRLWHPTTGCSHGCPMCWARRLVCDRLSGTMKGLPCGPAQGTDHLYAFDPTFHAGRLADPLRTKKPQIIGVSFLGDLFDPGITDERIAAVFGVMAAAQRHTFIVLTKQAERLRGWFAWLEAQARRAGALFGSDDRGWRRGHILSAAALRAGVSVSATAADVWPLRHVWLGVSVSGPGDTHRILDLQRTPAAHRWVSYEPAIDHLWFPMAGGAHDLPQVDAVIMGGESGPGWRLMDMDWARLMRDQCAERGIAFLLKQSAGMRPEHTPELDGVRHWDVPWMGGRA